MTTEKNGAIDAAGKRAVIFDFDGTIADSMRAMVQVFEDLTSKPEPYTDDEINRLRDMSVPDLLKALELPAWKVPILVIKGRKMLKKHLHGIAVHDGMADVIKTLHAHGVPLYVLSSNSTENVQKYLQWHRLSQYFTAVHGGAGLLGKAPHLLKLIAQGNLDTAQSWYVGDEMRDVSAARAVGLKIASVTWGYNTHRALESKKPDALVDDAKQLTKVLSDVWKK